MGQNDNEKSLAKTCINWDIQIYGNTHTTLINIGFL